MLDFDRVAERKIIEAMENGEFDDLPGAGEPLTLDDDSMVPEELRAAYRILKNAGLAPPEVRARADLVQAIEAECTAADAAGRRVAVRRLALLSMQLERSGVRLTEVDRYREQILTKLQSGDESPEPPGVRGE
ncbi:MAG: DnaJ family domain-containing protein [Pseudomonadota bacterium]